LTLIDACKQNGYTIDANNEEAVTAVCKYFQQDNSKGLLLMGYYGTGKTWLMRLVNEFISPVRIVSTENIMRETIKNESVPEKYLSESFQIDNATYQKIEFPFCFDELGGKNDRELNLWGTKTYPMSEILKYHAENKMKCHAITNFQLEDLQQLYGGETIDRMKEMFTIVKFKGGSRRK
jgi:DNA replication protein DnaC